MTIETDGIDVSNDEAIFADGQAVGYVSSGGYAHHVGKSMALGYVPVEYADDGTALKWKSLASYVRRNLGRPLYDPNGGKMRS